MTQATNRVRLKFAAMNLKKLATWKWSDHFHLLFFRFFCSQCAFSISSMCVFLCFISLPDQVFLLLGREIAPSELVLANPGKGFVAVAELLFMGAEPDARMRLRDAVAVVTILPAHLLFLTEQQPHHLKADLRFLAGGLDSGEISLSSVFLDCPKVVIGLL